MNPVIDFYDLFANGPLMDDLLDERIDLFGPLFATLVGCTFLGVLIYYYAMNGHWVRSARYASFWHWIGVLVSCALIVFGAHFITCLQMADRRIPRNPGASPNSITYFFDQPDSVFFGFAGQTAGLSVFLFILLSLLLKWGSSHAKKSPL